MKTHAVQCKSLLYPVKSNRITFNFYPHRVTLNYYLGCKFGCKYCYAWFCVRNYGFDISEFPNICIIKENSLEIFEKELSSKKWRNYHGIIQLGNLQDVYQPIENKQKMTRGILELLLKYRKPCGIITKSSLITNDIDILKEMSKKDLIQVDISIASTNELFKKHLEPFAPSFSKRFKTLELLCKNGISTGIFIDPALPYYTENSLEEIFKRAKDIGVNYLFIGSLHMRHWKYKIMEEALLKVNPDLNISNYMSFKKKVSLQHDYFMKIIKDGFSLSHKYNIELATPYPEYSTCSYNFGAFKHRYPLIYDHIEILFQYRDKFISYVIFSSHYDDNKYSSDFFKSLLYFWENKILFESLAFLTIIYKETSNGVEYCLKSDSKLQTYLNNNIYIFNKTKNYGTKANYRLFI